MCAVVLQQLRQRQSSASKVTIGSLIKPEADQKLSELVEPTLVQKLAIAVHSSDQQGKALQHSSIRVLLTSTMRLVTSACSWPMAQQVLVAVLATGCMALQQPAPMLPQSNHHAPSVMTLPTRCNSVVSAGLSPPRCWRTTARACTQQQDDGHAQAMEASGSLLLKCRGLHDHAGASCHHGKGGALYATREAQQVHGH